MKLCPMVLILDGYSEIAVHVSNRGLFEFKRAQSVLTYHLFKIPCNDQRVDLPILYPDTKFSLFTQKK